MTLRVKRILLDDMLETFDRFAETRDDPENPDCVVIRSRVGISQRFYYWVLKYGEDMEILAPNDIREAFIEKLHSLTALYGGNSVVPAAD